jgi:hypothetical protein
VVAAVETKQLATAYGSTGKIASPEGECADA